MRSALDRPTDCRWGLPVRVLDLFSGLGGWSAPFVERGHEVITVDIDPRFKPDIVADILEWTPQGSYDVVLASPPCEMFSTGGWHQHSWRMHGDKAFGSNVYEPLDERALYARALVLRTVDLIVNVIRPEFAIIENPRGLLRQLGIIPFPRQTAWYCHYGEPRAKPTDLWLYGWNGVTLRPPCHNQRANHPADCCCRDHPSSPRGSITGTQGMESALAAKIPYELAQDFCAELNGWSLMAVNA
jgi:hypothetical protein